MASINRMMTHQLLTPQQCAAIRADLTAGAWSDGLVGVGGNQAPALNYDLRHCHVEAFVARLRW